MIRVLPLFFKTCLLALVTLAMLSVPFAHRVGAGQVTPEMAQFVSMGGTLADICGETDSHGDIGCESCRIVAGMLLPPPVQTASGVSFSGRDISGLNHWRNPDRSAPHALPPVRGPPRPLT